MLRLAVITAGDARTLERAKLDRFFGRRAEKKKAMESLVIADGIAA